MTFPTREGHQKLNVKTMSTLDTIVSPITSALMKTRLTLMVLIYLIQDKSMEVSEDIPINHNYCFGNFRHIQTPGPHPGYD